MKIFPAIKLSSSPRVSLSLKRSCSPLKYGSEQISKISLKMNKITNSTTESINNTLNDLLKMDEMIKHYHGDDLVLNRRKVHKLLVNEHSFFQDNKNLSKLQMKYLLYANIGLSNSQSSLMRSVTNYLRATGKNYNAPERSKTQPKIFLKEMLREIILDLKEKKIDKHFKQNDIKINDMINKRNIEDRRKFSIWKKIKKEKANQEELQNIDLIHELRRKMLNEVRKPTVDMIVEQKNEKTQKLLDIRDRFIPEQKEKILERKKMEQKDKKKYEMTSKKSINNAYYQLISMSPKEKNRIKKKIEQNFSGISRFVKF